jgi:hypothetical protein
MAAKQRWNAWVILFPCEFLLYWETFTVIFYESSAYLAEDLQSLTGAIEGGGGTQMSAIKAEGFTNFMGVRIQCFVANISKSVIGVGLLTGEYGFEVSFR